MRRRRWVPYEEVDNQQWLAQNHDALYRQSRLDLHGYTDMMGGIPEYTSGISGYCPFFSIKEDVFHGRHPESR